ncbi:hypothetical protein KOR42_21360 [Thalassoglobus neptunius]|uniref:DNA ligase (ATP) n=2 Tax=Thalassoglobus neptunius TaxID=1938619 RepID=A0A5C5X738_9PLAN|nr:hypothetical protein KOR42_21360 [Thalassoglobus neptunius]
MTDSPENNDRFLAAQQRLQDLLNSVELQSSSDEILLEENSGFTEMCPSCESTEDWGTSSWCPNCGYYPKTGKSVFDDSAVEGLELDLDEDNDENAHKDEIDEDESSHILITGILLGLIASTGIGVYFFAPQLLPEPFRRNASLAVIETEEQPLEVIPDQPEELDLSSDTEAIDGLSEDEIASLDPEGDSALLTQIEDQPPGYHETSEGIVEDKIYQNDYAIIGYSTNAEGELRSVLLAGIHARTKRPAFAGKFSISIRDKNFLTALQESLDNHRTKKPPVPNPYNARWTTPSIFCTIHHNGVTPDGRILEGQMISFRDRTLFPASSDSETETSTLGDSSAGSQTGKTSESS